MKWVKTTERMPDMYYDYPKGIIFRDIITQFVKNINNHAQYDYYKGDHWEWLDDTPQQSFSREEVINFMAEYGGFTQHQLQHARAWLDQKLNTHKPV